MSKKQDHDDQAAEAEQVDKRSTEERLAALEKFAEAAKLHLKHWGVTLPEL